MVVVSERNREGGRLMRNRIERRASNQNGRSQIDLQVPNLVAVSKQSREVRGLMEKPY